ncbi:hypothetical protein VPNG_07182 [Cytospora leucostoma]|uniref:Glycosyl hydrolase family 32 N-terminal domain-containing protein n=1 Tax=Cytospora leucostoma TaxID=1230097 RepID=A0A423WJT4_9PEZI|nr:hypothetical protein VPNG_07182 [Cytospora leucostoma]
MAITLKNFVFALLSATSSLALVTPSPQTLNLGDLGLKSPSRRADSDLTGYLGVVFLGDEPDVYFYLSEGNDPISFSALNGGSPIIKPTLGTGGVRDPAIVTGGGEEEGQKWYIIGTDMDISKTTWAASERTGSRGVLVWESTNLVNWTNERLVFVEDETAGMVWAPEAIWHASEGQYIAYWASRFYDESDTNHTGSATNIKIRYAYTSDFKTFSAPETFIDYSPTDTIDLTILPYPNDTDTFLRFLKDETRKDVFVEYTTTGLFGNWTRPGGSDAYIRSQTEGPAAYWDNTVDGEVHLLVDYYGGDGYSPLVSTDPASNSGWANSNTKDFPTGLRHGSVLPINSTLYDSLSSAWV